jgi:hypothetical protein
MESIIQTTNKNCCFICGQWATDNHHCIHGVANRKLADRDGLTVMLCHTCHMNLHDKGYMDRELQKIAQARWMEYNSKSVDDFIKRYGKSFI